MWKGTRMQSGKVELSFNRTLRVRRPDDGISYYEIATVITLPFDAPDDTIAVALDTAFAAYDLTAERMNALTAQPASTPPPPVAAPPPASAPPSSFPERKPVAAVPAPPPPAAPAPTKRNVGGVILDKPPGDYIMPVGHQTNNLPIKEAWKISPTEVRWLANAQRMSRPENVAARAAAQAFIADLEEEQRRLQPMLDDSFLEE